MANATGVARRPSPMPPLWQVSARMTTRRASTSRRRLSISSMANAVPPTSLGSVSWVYKYKGPLGHGVGPSVACEVEKTRSSDSRPVGIPDRSGSAPVVASESTRYRMTILGKLSTFGSPQQVVDRSSIVAGEPQVESPLPVLANSDNDRPPSTHRGQRRRRLTRLGLEKWACIAVPVRHHSKSGDLPQRPQPGRKS